MKSHRSITLVLAIGLALTLTWSVVVRGSGIPAGEQRGSGDLADSVAASGGQLTGSEEVWAYSYRIGALDPITVPESTFSYSLTDIYDRLDTGAAVTPITFTEPSSGPTVPTGHSIDEIMAIAPAVDDTNGATQTQVLNGYTVWGLTSGQWGPITGTHPPAPVPKTGQTTSHYSGDDGALEVGVAWPSPRFITGTTGVVTDTLTGLVWLENTNCTVFSSGDSTGQNARVWTSAVAASNQLAGGYCGLTDGSSAGDWRLPNVREIQTLIDYGQYGPPLPSGHPFIGVQVDYYWSSTTESGDTNYAFRVGMVVGTVYWSNKTAIHYVWPVRDGQ